MTYTIEDYLRMHEQNRITLTTYEELQGMSFNKLTLLLNNMLQNEQMFMQQMNTMNQASVGMDQGIQITNSIGLETVAQLEKLRMLTISNIQQNAVMATTVLNAQQANVTTQTNLFTDLGTSADQRGW